MRTPNPTTKRVLGLSAAAALVLSGTVAGAAHAAVKPQTLKLSTATGPGANAGQVLTVTGKGFKNAAGKNQVKDVEFQDATCAATQANVNDATAKSVVSATKLVVTAPALALDADDAPKAYNLCVYNLDDELLGSAKYTVYVKPVVTSLSVDSGATLGGTEVGIEGTGFTKKSKVFFNDVAATKVTFGDATSLKAVAPKHAPATDVQVKVVTEGGESDDVAADNFDFISAIQVTPAYGDGTAGDVIEVSGVGFKTGVFGTAVNNKQIALVPAGTDLAAGQAVPTTNVCNTVQVESDTTLSCQLAANVNDGAYTVVLIVRDGTTATNIGSASAVSRSAGYFVSDF